MLPSPKTGSRDYNFLNPESQDWEFDLGIAVTILISVYFMKYIVNVFKCSECLVTLYMSSLFIYLGCIVVAILARGDGGSSGLDSRECCECHRCCCCWPEWRGGCGGVFCLWSAWSSGAVWPHQMRAFLPSQLCRRSEATAWSEQLTFVSRLFFYLASLNEISPIVTDLSFAWSVCLSHLSPCSDHWMDSVTYCVWWGFKPTEEEISGFKLQQNIQM